MISHSALVDGVFPANTFAFPQKMGAVYIAGTLPVNAHQQLQHPGNPAAQTRYVLERLVQLLNEAQCSVEDVSFVALYLRRWEDYASVQAVYAEYFPGEDTALQCIQCDLPLPGALVEISCIARTGLPALRL